MNAKARTTLRLLQSTFSPVQCDLAVATGQVVAAFALLPEHKRARLQTLLTMLDTPLLPFALIGRWCAFSDLDEDGRTRLLVAMGDSPIDALRTGFQALKRLCLAAAYAAVDEAGHNPLWPVIDYPGPRTDRPHEMPAMRLYQPAGGMMDADAVVIGSGAGGGVAAAILAQSGRRVVVLEAGPPAEASSFTQLEAQSMSDLYLDHGLAATHDLSVVLLAGSCIGGGTTVNWCTSLRLSARVAEQWREAAGGIDFGQTLTPHYAAVVERLKIAPAARHNANNAVLVRGCKALGWRVDTQPTNGASCSEGCGYCGFGCAYGSKQSMQQTYLRDAVEAGAEVVAEASAHHIAMDRGAVRAVHASYRGTPLNIRTPLVVLAAGALRSPAVLARSGLRGRHVGRHLKLHPTTALFATFDQPIRSYQGPMQSAYSDQFVDLEDGYGVTLEAAPAHPGLTAFALPWRSREQHASLMRDSSFAAALIVLTRDRDEGAVAGDERDVVRYRLSRYDAGHMLTGLNGVVDLAFAAGAKKVTTLHQQVFELSRVHASRGRRQAFSERLLESSCMPNRLSIFSAHQMGTCRMHRDAARGVVDECGAVHGTKGLHVADASVFPLASGVNPMLTIMALARRITYAIV